MFAANVEFQKWTTENEILEYDCQWKIQHAKYCLIPLVHIESPEYSDCDGNLKWRIGLKRYVAIVHPKRPSVCCYLTCEYKGKSIQMDDPRTYFGYRCTVRILYEITSPAMHNPGTNTPYMFNENPGDKMDLGYFYKCIGMLPEDDILTLSCRVKLIRSSERLSLRTGNPKADFLPFFIGMLREKKYSDIVIEVDQHEIKAHKIVLASYSPVFRKMFETGMGEAAPNRIVIKDLEYEVVDQMLQFMYTGESPEVATMADRLLRAAVKYDFGALRALCVKTLCSNLTVDNAFKMITLSHMYGAEKLTSATKKFIVDNIEQLTEATVWDKAMMQLKDIPPTL